jgi:hypothetical protein
MLARQRSKVLIAAAVLSVVGLSTVIAVTGGFTKNEAATAASLPQNSSQPAPVAAVQSELPVHKIAAETFAKSTRAVTERREEKRSKPEPEKSEPALAPEPEPAAQSIKVVMQIENGRVLKASIANPKPGLDSYEAMALRIARQRRYSSTKTGGETVTINVNK